jgi:glycosyltransferase involved in cell wall biosynthesis
VAAFDCPTGPREVLDPGVDGLLVPAEDIGALAAALNELIEDPGRRRAMGAAAFETSRRYFMPVVRDAWEDFLAELAATRAPGGRVTA